MAMNVGGAITPAMNHTERVLFKPFALRKWLGLGLVSMLAGGSGGGGSSNYRAPNSHGMDPIGRAVGEWVVMHLALIIAGVVLLFLVSLAFAWLGSVFRFVYLNQITRDPYAIRAPFGRFIGLGTSYFLWTLAFGLAMLVVLAVLIGIPLWGAFYRFHGGFGLFGPAQVLAIVWAVLAGIAILIASVVVDVFARDFVVTAMFARNVKIIQGWRIVLPIIRANAGQSVLYLLLLVNI